MFKSLKLPSMFLNDDQKKDRLVRKHIDNYNILKAELSHIVRNSGDPIEDLKIMKLDNGLEDIKDLISLLRESYERTISSKDDLYKLEKVEGIPGKLFRLYNKSRFQLPINDEVNLGRSISEPDFFLSSAKDTIFYQYEKVLNELKPVEFFKNALKKKFDRDVQKVRSDYLKEYGVDIEQEYISKSDFAKLFKMVEWSCRHRNPASNEYRVYWIRESNLSLSLEILIEQLANNLGVDVIVEKDSII